MVTERRPTTSSLPARHRVTARETTTATIDLTRRRGLLVLALQSTLVEAHPVHDRPEQEKHAEEVRPRAQNEKEPEAPSVRGHAMSQVDIRRECKVQQFDAHTRRHSARPQLREAALSVWNVSVDAQQHRRHDERAENERDDRVFRSVRRHRAHPPPATDPPPEGPPTCP